MTPKVFNLQLKRRISFLCLSDRFSLRSAALVLQLRFPIGREEEGDSPRCWSSPEIKNGRKFGFEPEGCVVGRLGERRQR